MYRIILVIFILSMSLFQGVCPSYTNADLDYVEYIDEDPPYFLARSQTFTVELGQSVIIPCDVENQGTHQLVIQKTDLSGESHLISAGGVKIIRTRRIKVERNKLSIQRARRLDAGLYTCSFPTAQNAVLRHSLDVQYPPSINSSSPIVQHIAKGDSVTLSCLTDGNPKPKIKWSYKGGVLPSGEPIEEGETLTLEDVDRHVEGTYICTADNGIGNAASASMKIIVEYPPEIITEKAIVRTGAGDKVELVCLVRGRPSPRVSWTRDGQPVTHTSHATTSNNAHRHTLVIRPVTEQDFGAYVCIAENIQGQKSAVVQMTGLPRQPHFINTPNGGRANSYTLTWETDSYYPITAYRLVYRKTKINASTEANEKWRDEYRQIDLKTDKRDGTDWIMSHTLHYLDVDTEYEAVVKVKNNYGWSADSERFSFATHTALHVEQQPVADFMSSATQNNVNIVMLLIILHI